jgi:hypothetical protein
MKQLMKGYLANILRLPVDCAERSSAVGNRNAELRSAQSILSLNILRRAALCAILQSLYLRNLCNLRMDFILPSA